ncbi:hypothetical protein VCHC50A2_1864B, partial [Vibrio cholerae HC-50A2]
TIMRYTVNVTMYFGIPK